MERWFRQKPSIQWSTFQKRLRLPEQSAYDLDGAEVGGCWEAGRDDDWGRRLPGLDPRPAAHHHPPVQYSQHFTSSSLSPVSASLFESINTIQYNPEGGSAVPPLTTIQLNEEKQQLSNIIKDTTSFDTNSTYSNAVTVKEFYAAKTGSPISGGYEVSPAPNQPPPSPGTGTSAQVEAMLTTLQPFNPTSLVQPDNQGTESTAALNHS